VSAAVLSDLSISATALIEATVVFWLVHLAVQFLALRVLIRQPSVALAGLLAVASTTVALVIVTVVVRVSACTVPPPTSSPRSSSG